MSRAWSLLFSLPGIGCLPELTPPEPESVVAAEWRAEPRDEVGRPLPVSRFTLTGPEPQHVLLVRGTLSPQQQRAWADGVASDAVLGRSVETTLLGGVAIPHHRLEPGVFYTLAAPPPLPRYEFRVSEAITRDATRVFPASGEVMRSGAALYCAPGGFAAQSTQFAGSAHELVVEPLPTLPDCALLHAVPELPEGRYHPPAELGGVQVEPTPWDIDPTQRGPRALGCGALELELGPGCARIHDDRLFLRAPLEPMLWVVTWPGGSHLAVTAEGRGFWLKGLAPASEVTLKVATLTLASSALELTERRITTGSAQAHVILNEVYSDAIGPEPESEWVELYNDGLAGIDLAELVLEDVGGSVALPSTSLPPSGFAVLVSEGFVPQPDYDVAPDPSALLVVLPSLGKNGLKNDGEPLRLVRGGEVISRFPGAPKPKPGQSVARVDPLAADDDPSSFARTTTPTPGWSNSVSP